MDQLVSQTVDYTVNWLGAASTNSAADVSTQDDLNNLVCDISGASYSNIPSSANFVVNTGSDKGTAYGVATTGVLIFSAISGEGVDPFYPAAYGSVTDPDSVVEAVDWCLAHP